MYISFKIILHILECLIIGMLFKKRLARWQTVISNVDYVREYLQRLLVEVI